MKNREYAVEAVVQEFYGQSMTEDEGFIAPDFFAMAREILNLRAERDALLVINGDLDRDGKLLEAERDALRKDAEQLDWLKDSERLDWLEKYGVRTDWCDPENPDSVWVVFSDNRKDWDAAGGSANSATLREAIDAALEVQP
jgi:hypothetical protein